MDKFIKGTRIFTNGKSYYKKWKLVSIKPLNRKWKLYSVSVATVNIVMALL